MAGRKNLRKTLALTLACVATFLSGNVTQSMADEIAVEQVELDSEGIATAYIENEDGTMEPLDCKVTLSTVEGKERGSNGVSKIHTLEVTTDNIKNSSDSKNEDGITLSGTIRWKDNLGAGNTFLMVFGHGSGATPTGNYKYEYGKMYTRETIFGSGEFPNGGNFSNTKGYGKTGLEFFLRVKANLSDGKGVMLQINTSIFD